MKRVISVLAAFVLLISTVIGVPFLANANQVDAWDGTVATDFAGGTGTVADPYLIATPEQLAKMVKGGDTTGGYYKLTADIYLNDVSQADWASNSPNEWYDRADISNTAFVGNFDGDGHTIHGLYYTGSSMFALFPQANNTTITNLCISNAYVNSTEKAAALISFGQGTLNFKKCIVDETVTLSNNITSGDKGLAGFVAYGSANINIEDSAVMATITAESYKGAFFGNCWSGTRTVKNSFSATDVPMTGHHSNKITATNCYTIGSTNLTNGTITKLDNADLMKGTAANTNMPNLNWKGVWQTTESGYPTYRDTNGVKGEVWSSAVADDFAGGTGTETDPYLIETPEQLAKMVKDGDATSGKYYVLGADIYLNDVSKTNWTDSATMWVGASEFTSASFQGNLDGAGYTVYGIYLDVSGSWNAGLVPAAKGNVTFKNLTVSDSYIKSTHSDEGAASAFVGNLNSGTVSFDKCRVTESVNAIAANVAGGFVANGSGTVNITNSVSLGHFESLGVKRDRRGSMVGGIWGTRAVNVDNSFAKEAFTNYFATSITNSYTAEQLNSTVVQATYVSDVELMKGEAAKTNMSGLNWDEVWATTTSGYPIFKTEVTPPSDIEGVWDGTVATDFAGGTGIETDPYLIETPEQLAKMVKDGDATSGKYYVLGADIYLNDVSKTNWTDSATMWVGASEFTSASFQGNLDGAGYTVYGIYLDVSGSWNAGLVVSTKGTATFKNLTVSDSYIKNTHSSEGAASAFVGNLSGGSTVSFDKCRITESVNVVAANVAGGFVANGSGTINITNCASLGHFESQGVARDRRGSMVGGIYWSSGAGRNVSINNSFAIEAFTNYYATSITNSYTAEQLDSTVVQATYVSNVELMKGTAAKTNMPNLNWKTVWKTTETGYPEFKGDVVIDPTVWDGTVATAFAGGTGTETDPYLIETPSQLAKMVKEGNTEGGYYKLTADIKLNDISQVDWTENSPNRWYDRADINNIAFVGNLDGDGHTIYGLYYNGSSIFALFPQASNTTIKNLRISNAYVNSTEKVAALVGFGKETLRFSKCIVDETVTLANNIASGDKGIAGFVAYGTAKIHIEDSAVMATITANEYKGAFIGNVWGNTAADRSITNSFSATDAPMTAHTTNSITVEKCYSVGTETLDYTGTVTKLDSADLMKGTQAKTNMPNLNWKTVWKTTETGYPEYVGEVIIDPTVWDGTVATDFAGGDGEKATPYIITNGAQLAKMVTDGDATAGKYYVLANDIKLNDVTDADWKNYANKWVITGNYFQGNFDGAGYTVSGLYYTGTENYVGLFTRVKGNVSISNLFLSSCHMETSGYAASALIGFVSSGSNIDISRVYANESVEVISTCSDEVQTSAAGFVAYGNGTITIDSSAFLGTVESPVHKASMIGNVWNSTKIITNSFASAEIPFNSKQTISDSSKSNYGVGTTLTAENGVIRLDSTDKMKGTQAKTNMPKLNWINVWKPSETGYPVYMDMGDMDTTVWNGTIADSFAGGDGSEKNPYKISNGAELAKMATDGDATSGKYYVLTADIKLNDVSAENWIDFAVSWVGTGGVFQGNLDGAGHTVYGMYYSGSDKASIGLVSRADGSVSFKRIVISDAYIEANSEEGSAAAFIGWITAGATARFDRCYITESVICKTANTAAGFVANGSGKIYIENSASLGHFESPKRHGSMVGGIYWSATTDRTVSVNQSFAKEAFTNYYIGKILDSYSSEKLTDVEIAQPTIISDIALMKGENAKTNMPLLDWKNMWFEDENGFPVLNFTVYKGTVGGIWSGAAADSYASGNGTKDDPYIIETPEQLAKLCSNLTVCRDKYYKLAADIYLNDVSKEDWKENNPNHWYWSSSSKDTGFDGHFDGDGHVIYGMYLDLLQTTEVVYAGLFSAITDGAVIEKVGISDAYMRVKMTDESIQGNYVAGIAGSVFYKDDNAPRDPAYISQCFGSTSVYLEGRGTGGIVCGVPRPVVIEDCYFVGKLNFSLKGGAIIGDTWLQSQYTNAAVRRCYSATADSDYLAAGRAGISNSFSTIDYVDNYSTYLGLSSFQTRISVLMMRGDAAKKNMKGLDFDKVWYALPNGTPVLRVFGTTDKFSNTTDPKPIEITFISNGGTECENMYGNPEDALKLPTPEREGYKFAGWFVYKELDIEYTYDFFPYFDQTLYAKWEKTSFIQDFEDYANTMYDYGEDYEYYRPGTFAYDSSYVKGGVSSMHRIGNEDYDADFLVFYEDLLKVGTEYEMKFYVSTDTEDTSFDLSLVHEDWPDIYDSDSGVELIKKFDSISSGEWIEVTYKFVAKTQWIAIRTTGNASIFFDDFMVTTLRYVGIKDSDEKDESDKQPAGKDDEDIEDTSNPTDTEDDEFDFDDYWQDTDEELPEFDDSDEDETESEVEDGTEDDEDESSKEVSNSKDNNKKTQKADKTSYLWLIILSAVVLAVLIAGAVVAVVIIKKRKTKV